MLASPCRPAGHTRISTRVTALGGHRHRPGIGSLPSRIDDLPDARRPDRRNLSGVSRPDPDEDVLFDDRDGTQPSLPRNVTVRIRRYSDALARPVVEQAVIGAFEQAAFDEPPL